MRILGLFISAIAIVFYLGRIIRLLSGSSGKKPVASGGDSIDNRLKKAKQADVIEVKTVVSGPKD